MITVLLLLLELSIGRLHPIHISVSDVEINSQEIKWTARIYKDDLLYALYGKVTDMTILDDQEKVKKDILIYISRNVSITYEGSVFKWTLVDIQPDPEAIWITVSTPIEGKILQSMTVRNRILLDVYGDQKNVVNFTWSTGKKNMLFDKGCDQKLISF